MVREARLELAQDCSPQPLKLVRLPFRHSRTVIGPKYPGRGSFILLQESFFVKI